MGRTLQHHLVCPTNQLSHRQVETCETGGDGLAAGKTDGSGDGSLTDVQGPNSKGAPTFCAGAVPSGLEPVPPPGRHWMPHPADDSSQTGSGAVYLLLVCPPEL